MNPLPDTLAPERSFRALLGEALWARLLERAERLELPAGSVLMRRGEREVPLYVIEEGAIEVVDARSSPETVLSVLGEGHVIGDMSFVDQAPASADVRARAHSRVARWPREELATALEEDATFALAFHQALAVTVVARSRNLMSAAVVGGFGASLRERDETAELEATATALAAELLSATAGARSAEDPVAISQMAEGLTSVCRWFAVSPDADRAEAVGERLRALLAEPLTSSAIASAMIARQEGTPAGPELFRRVLAGEAAGRDVAGKLLDGALLGLPTFRGWRWRDTALAGALARILPATGARVLSVSLTGTPTSDAQLAVLRARGGHVSSVQLAQRPESGPAPEGITRTTVGVDLPSLLRGSGPWVAGQHHVVIVDRVSDVVPDEVLRSLLAWARLQLAPRGQLLVGHALPADDVAMLDQLLRWPSLPRRRDQILGLLPRGGHHDALDPQDDEAAGLVLWRAT